MSPRDCKRAEALCSTVISPNGIYRYRLCRKYAGLLDRPFLTPCVFVMLNPSTADADRDDPTIRRCLGYARAWGRGDLFVVNLFALRATDPSRLYAHADPVGPENEGIVREIVGFARLTGGIVVCGWGRHGVLHHQDRAMLRWLRDEGVAPHCLATTRDGQPRHPLYLPRDLSPVPYEGRAAP